MAEYMSLLDSLMTSSTQRFTMVYGDMTYLDGQMNLKKTNLTGPAGGKGGRC